MSEKIFVSDLVEGAHICSVFLVTDKSVRATKSGKPFLALSLRDKSGSIDSKVWENAEAIATRFEIDDFVRVEAQVDSWQSQLQLNVRDAQKIEDSEVIFADFVPVSRWPRPDLVQQLQELVAGAVKTPLFKRLFEELFADESLMQRYCAAPAAKGNHHAFLGGLLEHSLSMARLAAQLGGHYENYYPGLINTDLLIAGCVFHDIGKCFELSFSRSFDYTEAGQFVGHIVQGVELLTLLAGRIEPALPAEMILQIKHLILSHHGKKEYGSPVLPKTPEAMLLHEIDMIDSRMNMLANIAETQGEVGGNAGWTGYQRLFGERLYLGAPTDENASWVVQDLPRQEELAGPGRRHDQPAPAQHPVNSAARAARGPKSPAAQAETQPPDQPAEVAPNLDLFSD